MTDKVQKIKEWVRTRKLCTMDEHMKFYCKEAESDYNLLCSLEKFLDSIQEEPVSEKKCIFTKDNYTDEDMKVLCDGCEEECKYAQKEEPVSEIWHNTNEKPNYVEGDTYANSILVFGNTKLGYGASVCNMIDKDTIYAPISNKEYEWNKCPFTMWAYIRDLLLKREEPVSEELEEACEQLAENARKHKAETSSPFFSQTDYRQGVIDGAQWQKEQLLKDAVERIVKVDAGGYPYIDDTELYDYSEDKPLAKAGDKVKIVIIKEESV